MIISPTHDALYILAARALRSFGYGALGTVLAVYLDGLGLGSAAIGIVLTAALLGSLGMNVFWSVAADRFGRRRTVVLMGVLMAFSGLIFAFTNELWLLVLTAFLGTISATAAEVGPFQTVEQAMIPETVADDRRTWMFSIYGMLGYWAGAIGSLCVGFAEPIGGVFGWTLAEALRSVFIIYALIGVANAVLFALLSPAVEAAKVDGARRLIGLDRSKTIVAKLSLLFAVDAFAGGLVVHAIASYWFHIRFGLDLRSLGMLFFAVQMVSGLSQLGAAPLARRFGLLNTMVWTHVPSSIALILIPFAPTVEIAIALFLLRMTVSQMDVPTRQSYLAAIVSPSERTAAAGLTNIARGAALALSPPLATAAIAAGALSVPFVAAGVMKIAYDLVVWQAFRGVVPPEETHRHAHKFKTAEKKGEVA